MLDALGLLDGIATLRDIEGALLDNRPGTTLAYVASRPVVTVFLDESLSQAVHRMGVHDIGQVPVVARAEPTRVIGMLRRSDVVRAYTQAMLGRLESQVHRPIRPRELRGTRIVELTVGGGWLVAGLTLGDLHLPPDTLVVAIQRHTEKIFHVVTPS